MVLTVRDDGIGSVASLWGSAKTGTGLGLRALSDRFTSGGGTFDIQDREGGGIEIRSTLPQEAA